MAAEVEVQITATDNFSTTLGNFGNIVTGIKSAIDLVGDVFRTASNVIGGFVNEAAGSQLAMADLEAVVKSTGGAAGYTAEQLMDMAGQLQNVTRFSDETIAKGEGMLATFTNIGHDIFPMATQAMLDMGEKFGSVDSAAVQLGKALNDPVAGITALTRVGVSFTDQQKEMIKGLVEAGDIMGAQKIILAELTKEFGGAAEAAGNTFAGQLEIAKNRISDIKESIGNAMLPALSSMMDAFSQLLDSPAAQQFLNTVVAGAKAAADAVAEFVNDKLPALLDALNSGNYAAVIQVIFGDVNAETISAFIEKLDSQIADAVNEGVASGAFRSSGDAFGNMLLSALGQGMDTAQSKAAPALGQALGEWLRGAIGEVYFQHSSQDVIAAMLNLMLATLRNNPVDRFFDSAIGIGKAIVQGLIAGIQQGWAEIGNWVQAQVDDFIGDWKRFLGIASPSTVFMDIGKNIVQGLWDGMSGMWSSFTTWVETKFTNLLSNLSWENILAVITGNMSVSDLFGSGSGGGSVPYSPGGYGPGGYTPPAGGGTTGGTTTTGLGGVINNFYAPVYFGDMSSIGYDCPSPHPLMTASSQSLLTGSNIG